MQGPVGATGGQGDRGPKGDKGDRGAPAVEIDIVSELCKHLPIAIVEQYHRGAYVRYPINLMEDIELHDAARVKSIIDKGGHCNAVQSDITRMATLSKTQVNSNYVLNFHNDAYNMEADIHNFHYFCVLVYKIKAYAKTDHWEHNYLISNWTGEKEAKYRGICFLPDKKTLRIHGAGGVGSNDTFGFRVWRKTNPCKENRFHVICVEYVKRQMSSYSSLWVNGTYLTNCNSTALSGSDQRITLGNIHDGGDTISRNYCCNGNLCGYHRRGAWSYEGRDIGNAMS